MERLFLYLRLRRGDELVARSKIREFAGLGALMADFLRSTPLPPEGPLPVLEYVEAGNEEVLLSFAADPDGNGLRVRGRIPPEHRQRMLDPAAASCSVFSFVDRAAPELTEEERERMAERIGAGPDLLARIRAALDDEGRFELLLPFPPEEE